MRKREPTVHDKTTLRLGDQPLWARAGLVQMNERGRVGDVEGLEAEVLEDELVGGALDGGEGEGRLGEEEGAGRGADAEVVREEVGPDVALQVGVYEVAAVDEIGRAHV